MARYDHLPIFQSAYKLCIESYKITGGFNREYKYTLGEKIKNHTHDVIDNIVSVNSLPNDEKATELRNTFLNLEKLRMCFRISCDLKILSPRSLGKVSENMEEIEKQARGWQKWVQSKS